MNPKVSIIIPAHDNSSTIASAVKSCLVQEYDTFEIVIVDDGSSDNTGELIHNTFSSEIEQGLVRYYFQPNAGSGAARNSGIRMAQGDYIAFLDADDILLDNSIASRAQFLSDHSDLSLVFSDYTMLGQTNHTQERVLASRGFLPFCAAVVFRSTTSGVIFEPTFYTRSLQFTPFPIWTGAIMIRKTVFDSTGPFREDLLIANDYDMWIRILRLPHRTGYIDEPLAVYQHNVSTLTKVLGEEYYSDAIRSCLNFLTSERDRMTQRIFRHQLADLYFELGYGFWKQKHYAKSRSIFLRALWFSPIKYKALKLFVATLLPHALFRSLREPFNE